MRQKEEQQGGNTDNMALKNRTPLQVSPEFKKKLDEIQKKIMLSQGEKKSLREITSEIISSPMFNEIEKNIIKSGDIKMDIKIKLDRRILQ
jgi:hypothetical protein